jgi:hypothetical protein
MQGCQFEVKMADMGTEEGYGQQTDVFASTALFDKADGIFNNIAGHQIVAHHPPEVFEACAILILVGSIGILSPEPNSRERSSRGKGAGFSGRAARDKEVRGRVGNRG